ncbi:hypothetical protein Q4578_11170 [Shimia thalassica]|uniref:hypothetical protein n=1 Tax=Shimia thalassica TaxID=1715693 RepID=UPI0026E17A46|nr:hypothetical protein [Shimia thalassica]MDO6477988.1 hypothetical protein [Shimia thalassica]MDO6522151.1 hypothetical protein [Shimia thalassica]MDP2518953.1 hypothetical protein [Shimia thalassica]
MGNLSQIQLVTSLARSLKQNGYDHIARALHSAQHFEIDIEIFKAAARFTIEMFREDECFVDSIALPPAEICTLRIGKEPTLYLARKADDRVELIQLAEGGHAVRRYAWRCGTNEVSAQSFFEANTDDVQFVQGGLALTLPMMLTLINSPKLVEICGNGLRQERRQASRSTRIAVDAWHKVSWRTAARYSRSSEPAFDGPKKPLHYRRGHLRKALEHHSKAFPTKLTETGWGQWIDGQWVGHPSLGIKRSKYSPKLDQQGLQRFVEAQRTRDSKH